jgi:hypothetical protein
MILLGREVRPSQAWNVLPELDVDNKFLTLGLYWDKDAGATLPICLFVCLFDSIRLFTVTV